MLTLFDTWESNKLGVRAGAGSGRWLRRRVIVDALSTYGGSGFPGGSRGISHDDGLGGLVETVTGRHSPTSTTIRLLIIIECDVKRRKRQRSRLALVVF